MRHETSGLTGPHPAEPLDRREATPAKSGRARLRAGLVERWRLVEQLREGRDRALTLVCAPAGYGKTTLLAQWEAADGEHTPFAWISLDERDADPRRLWRRVVTGTQAASGRACETSLAALAAGPGAIAETLVPCLIDELSGSAPIVLILEDWHAVRNPLCDAAMAAFIQQAGASVQIVISSRSDPGLHVARLRAHGDLAEVRARDLRLSLAEATALVHAANLPLQPLEIECLTRRTEGWLAGFCLALLAVKGQPDPRRFVTDFSGTTKHVLDYLAQDVLGAVAPDVRDFLVRTSVLDRFSPDLCDAVLETSDSASMLTDVERANLFLVSLDDAGVEYRYHRLFATMLKRELKATQPEAVARLYARASEWHEANGHVEESVGYATAARDVRRASRLVARHAQEYSTTGRQETLLAWLEALSWPEARDDPQLALVRASADGLAARGREAVEHWLRIAEAAPDEGPLANGIASHRSGVALVRSLFLTRGAKAAVADARGALELEPLDSPWRPAALVALGQALYLLGLDDEARDALDEARTLPAAAAWAPAAALGLSYRSLIALASGDAATAARIARGALELVEAPDLASGIAAASPHLALGCVLAQGPDVHGAVSHLERAVGLAVAAGASYWRAHALLRLASARHRLGEALAAREALALARADLDELPCEGALGALLVATEDDLCSPARREGFLGEDLSDSELRILRRLAEGLSITEIGQELWLSPNTVKTHRRSIYRKLGVASREGLRERAVELRLLDASGSRDGVLAV